MTQTKNRIMQKKGQIEPVSFVVFVIVAGSIAVGSFLLIQSQKEDFSYYYVGDTISKNVYSFNCLDKIAETNRILFPNIDSAAKLNYTYKSCPP